MNVTQNGKEISCGCKSTGGSPASGSGIIPANQNSVTIAHGYPGVPGHIIGLTCTNDVTVSSGIQAAISGANIIVGYGIGITQPADGTFDFEVGA